VTIAALSLAAPRGARAESFSISGERVAIYNLVGEVRLEAGTGRAVLIEIERGGDDAEDLRVETGPYQGAQTLRVVYPGNRVVYRGGGSFQTTVRVASNGIFNESGMGARKITVASSGSGTEAHADLTIRVPRGQRIAVYLAAGEMWASNVEGQVRLDTHCAPVNVDGCKGDLVADVGSGSVNVANVEGDVNLDSGSGGVRLAGVKGRHVMVDTGSGRVVVEDVECTELMVDTGSGGVRMKGIKARQISVDTGSGGVELALLDDIESLLVDTGSGGVTIVAPRGLGADLEIETGSGGIDVEFPIEVIRAGRDYLRGKLGDGAGSIRIETGSGGVRVREG
jgi:DUF4097 and DUF4098 domain-containing protein YvlB